MFTRPAPPLACLPDRNAVYAPPRWVGQQSFPELCALTAMQSRAARVAATKIHTWSDRGGERGNAYREYCSNAATRRDMVSNAAARQDMVRGDTPYCDSSGCVSTAGLDCVTISDEFAIVPAHRAPYYFADTWRGMSQNRKTPTWGSDPRGDATTMARCCTHMNCQSVNRACSSCNKWAPEGVLTRQVLYGGGRIGVLEMDTVPNAVPGDWHCVTRRQFGDIATVEERNSGHHACTQQHEGSAQSGEGGSAQAPAPSTNLIRRWGKKGKIWRWLRTSAATSMHMRDTHCQGMYALSKL